MTTGDWSAVEVRVAAASEQDKLDFYTRPSKLTTPGRYGGLLEPLPHDIPSLTSITQCLLIHEFMASAYGVSIPEHRKRESHIRGLEKMLEALLDLDARPLTVARTSDRRLVGVCNHFAVLLVGMLRAQGVPARARWGFGSYFNPPFFEDHVLGEYWHPSEARWIRVDAQLDAVFRKAVALDFDPLDVPASRFVTAGDAWARCRSGQADPTTFGTVNGDLRGLWFMAGSLVKDMAALNKMEMLPWDVWGAMPAPGTPLQDEQLEFFDWIAALDQTPDESFAELRKTYESDDRLRVPAAVFNALLQRTEAV